MAETKNNILIKQLRDKRSLGRPFAIDLYDSLLIKPEFDFRHAQLKND